MTDTTTANTTATPRPSRRLIAGAVTLCALGVAGAVAGIVLAVGSPAHHAGTAAGPDAGSGSSSSARHGTAPLGPTGRPSPQIATLQHELGLLNYYEGPDSGYLNTATEQAVSYLQRSAGLPQTGTMNAATDRALAYQLAHGDNTMAG